MAETELEREIENWSPLMKRSVLDVGQRPSKQAVKSLTEREIDRIRELAGDKKAHPEVRMDKMLAVLAERAPDGKTVSTLGLVLADKARAPQLRELAAVHLGRIGGKAARKALSSSIRDENPRVAMRAIQALGLSGDAATLKALEKIEPPRFTLVARQLEFSKKLVRHRLGKQSDVPIKRIGTEWKGEGGWAPRELSLHAAQPADIKAALANLENPIQGLELSLERSLTLNDQGVRQDLFLSRDLDSRVGLARALKQPIVAGLLTSWDDRTRRAVIDAVILAEPVDDEILIQGFRLDGTPILEGRATIEKNTARFSVTHVSRAGQCRFRLHGEIDGRGIKATAETMERQSPRVPTPLVGSPL